MNIVFDASALIAYLRGEPGADIVEAHLSSDDNELYAHSVNLCEVYYDFLRASDENSAEQAISDILALGVRERSEMSSHFWRTAGKLKAEHRRVSLADCCALALAIHLDATLVTADRHELEPLSSRSICRLEFIR